MRGLKYLFSIPKSEKMTEKQFLRLFLTSLCSILLCMGCLVSTTWALFSVTIESEHSQIYVPKLTPKLAVGGTVGTSCELEPSDNPYSVVLRFDAPESTADALNRKATRYILLTIEIIDPVEGQDDPVKKYYVALRDESSFEITQLVINQKARLSVAASWIQPSAPYISLPAESGQIDPVGTKPVEKVDEEETVIPEDENSSSEPDDETDLSEPDDSAEPETPSEPVDQNDSVSSSEPSEPTEPETPTESEEPTEPETSSEPTAPEE